jgi:NADH dehydrogenase FAD-containing subunit
VINNNNSIDRKIHLTQRPAPRVVVVGAGAAGIELSLAFQYVFFFLLDGSTKLSSTVFL